MQSNNPVQRRVKLGLEKDSLLLLKQLVNPQFLKQPETDLEIFNDHKPVVPVRKPKVEWSHSYDKNAAYLGVAASVSVGIGEPTHIQSSYPLHFDSNRLVPGIWLIDCHDLLWPWPLNLVPNGKSWQYSPVVNYLIENHIPFDCYEGHYFEDGKQIFLRLYNYLKKMREENKDQAKEIYTRLWGLLAHKSDHPYPGYVYRPDWYGTIIAENKVRIHRQAIQAYYANGFYPVGWRVDMLYYQQEMPFFKLGTGIGEWKHECR